MPEDIEHNRRPGDRVIRRRIGATQVVDLPKPRQTGAVPHTGLHAQRFVVAFLVVVLLGAIVLALPWSTEQGTATPPIDAFFTAVSASSVTGLIVVDTQDHWNFLGELVILTLIQTGGLGFMVGASLVLVSLRRGQSLRDTLLLQDGSPTLSLQEASQLSRRILKFMLVAEGIGALVLAARFARDESVPVAIWHGVFTSVAAFCNAGFDLQGGYRSMALYVDSPWVNAAIMLLIQAGALSYVLFSDVWTKRRWRTLTLDVKLVLWTNFVMLGFGAIGFLVLEWHASLSGLSVWAKPLAALFQSTSMRTAGFASIGFGDAHPATLFMTVGVMMVGGAAGSTAGGIKLATVAILVVAVLATVRGETEPQVFGRRIATALVYRAMAVTSLFVAAHFALTLALSITEEAIANKEFGILPLMFETMSGLATVGLTTGITPEISGPGKFILCLAMFLGRLGPLTVAYALQRRQRQPRYRYAQASVRIG